MPLLSNDDLAAIRAHATVAHPYWTLFDVTRLLADAEEARRIIGWLRATLDDLADDLRRGDVDLPLMGSSVQAALTEARATMGE